MTERAEDRKRWRDGPKPTGSVAEQVDSPQRRETLKTLIGAGILTGSNIISGSVGVAVGSAVERASNVSQREIDADKALSDVPAIESQELQISPATYEAFANGDKASIEEALKMIDVHTTKLRAATKICNDLHPKLQKLLSSGQNEGLQNLYESQIQISTQEQQTCIANIKTLRELVRTSEGENRPVKPEVKRFGGAGKITEG